MRHRFRMWWRSEAAVRTVTRAPSTSRVILSARTPPLGPVMQLMTVIAAEHEEHGHADASCSVRQDFSCRSSSAVPCSLPASSPSPACHPTTSHGRGLCRVLRADL